MFEHIFSPRPNSPQHNSPKHSGNRQSPQQVGETPPTMPTAQTTAQTTHGAVPTNVNPYGHRAIVHQQVVRGSSPQSSSPLNQKVIPNFFGPPPQLGAPRIQPVRGLDSAPSRTATGAPVHSLPVSPSHAPAEPRPGGATTGGSTSVPASPTVGRNLVIRGPMVPGLALGTKAPTVVPVPRQTEKGPTPRRPPESGKPPTADVGVSETPRDSARPPLASTPRDDLSARTPRESRTPRGDSVPIPYSAPLRSPRQSPRQPTSKKVPPSSTTHHGPQHQPKRSSDSKNSNDSSTPIAPAPSGWGRTMRGEPLAPKGSVFSTAAQNRPTPRTGWGGYEENHDANKRVDVPRDEEFLHTRRPRESAAQRSAAQSAASEQSSDNLRESGENRKSEDWMPHLHGGEHAESRGLYPVKVWRDPLANVPASPTNRTSSQVFNEARWTTTSDDPQELVETNKRENAPVTPTTTTPSSRGPPSHSPPRPPPRPLLEGSPRSPRAGGPPRGGPHTTKTTTTPPTSTVPASVSVPEFFDIGDTEFFDIGSPTGGPSPQNTARGSPGSPRAGGMPLSLETSGASWQGPLDGAEFVEWGEQSWPEQEAIRKKPSRRGTRGKKRGPIKKKVAFQREKEGAMLFMLDLRSLLAPAIYKL